MREIEQDSDQNRPAGSSIPGEPDFLVIGKLRRPHGIKGELVMEVWTDFPERLRAGEQVYVGSQHLPLRVRSIREHGKFLLIGFLEYKTPEMAGALRNQWVYVRSDDRPELPAGEYYHHQLLNLEVVSDADELLGVVVEILETGSNDVLVVRPASGAEILLPMIDEVVLAIDLEAGRILAHLLPGL